MLRLLPRAPRKITAGQLHQQLTLERFDVTKRSVERDLQELSRVFPIQADERERPYGWFWQRDAPRLEVPGLTPTEALTFAMAQQLLTPLLPSSALAQLSPYFRAAHNVLRTHPHGTPWTAKVRAVAANQALLPPNIAPQVHGELSEALLQDRQLEIRFARRNRSEASLATVHPLALVQRGVVMYLVCVFDSYADPRLVVVHRIESARMLEAAARRPKGFDIDAYIAGGAFGFGGEQTLRLEVRFERRAGQHLIKTPLSADQTVKVLSPTTLEIVATVHDNPQLRWWLLAFGDQVEVLKPASLREEILKIAQAMLKRHT